MKREDKVELLKELDTAHSTFLASKDATEVADAKQAIIAIKAKLTGGVNLEVVRNTELEDAAGINAYKVTKEELKTAIDLLEEAKASGTMEQKHGLQLDILKEVYANRFPPEKETGFGGTDTQKLVDALKGEGLNVQQALMGNDVFATAKGGLRYVINPQGSGKYHLKTAGADLGIYTLEELLANIAPKNTTDDSVYKEFESKANAALAVFGFEKSEVYNASIAWSRELTGGTTFKVMVDLSFWEDNITAYGSVSKVIVGDRYGKDLLNFQAKPVYEGLDQIVSKLKAVDELAGNSGNPPASKWPAKVRESIFSLIWNDTHSDFKGRAGGVRSILMMRNGGTTTVPLDDLTDAEIARKLGKDKMLAIEYALAKEWTLAEGLIKKTVELLDGIRHPHSTSEKILVKAVELGDDILELSIVPPVDVVSFGRNLERAKGVLAKLTEIEGGADKSETPEETGLEQVALTSILDHLESLAKKYEVSIQSDSSGMVRFSWADAMGLEYFCQSENINSISKGEQALFSLGRGGAGIIQEIVFKAGSVDEIESGLVDLFVRTGPASSVAKKVKSLSAESSEDIPDTSNEIANAVKYHALKIRREANVSEVSGGGSKLTIEKNGQTYVLTPSGDPSDLRYSMDGEEGLSIHDLVERLNSDPAPAEPEDDPVADALTALDSIISGAVTDADEADSAIDEAYEALEQAGLTEEHDDKLNEAADKLTELQAAAFGGA